MRGILLFTSPTANAAVRLFILGLAMLGLSGVAPIAFQQFTSAGACPALGLIPACYMVLVGYALIGISVLVRAKWRSVVFAAGWIPLFGLALTGTILELSGQNVCPKSTHGIPACFLSLGLLFVILLVFALQLRFRPDPGKKVISR